MNHFDQLISHIKEIVDITDRDSENIVKKFKPRELKKKEILLYKGEVSSHMRYIVRGCLRSYFIDDDAQEHIIQFGIENWWINDLYSYLTQTPAKHFVQALRPTTVLQIQRNSLEVLFKEVPAMDRFFRLKIQNAYVALQERALHNMSLTAAQRYRNFRTKYRDIEQRVPQYMIAAYLGVTPEFLSSIRKNIASIQFS